jgi:hypothetical protein
LTTDHGWRIAGVAVGELQQEGELPRRQGLYGAVGVYERISLHADWIDQIIAADVVISH